jgi:antirestriction protein ArdC
VFNAEQCDGLPAHYYAKAEPAWLIALSQANLDVVSCAD